MGTDGAVGSLMFMTLGIALIVAVLALLWFRRKRGNRHPMDGVRERNIEEIRAGDPPRRE